MRTWGLTPTWAVTPMIVEEGLVFLFFVALGGRGFARAQNFSDLKCEQRLLNI